MDAIDSMQAPHDVRPGDSLIENHIGYAHAIAAEVLKKYTTADRPCLQSAAELGLVQAARDFDPSRGVSFPTFAYYRIRGAVYDEVRQNCRANKFEMAANEYMRNYTATLPAKSRHTHISEGLEELTSDLITTYILSLEGLHHSPSSAVGDSPAEQLLANEQRGRVHRALQQLPERHRAVLYGYYYQDLSFKEIGRELNLSESWVSRIHAKGITLMSEVLQQENKPAKTPDTSDLRHRAFPLKKSKSYTAQPITGKSHEYDTSYHFSAIG